jgi:hypothetical protein
VVLGEARWFLQGGHDSRDSEPHNKTSKEREPGGMLQKRNEKSLTGWPANIFKTKNSQMPTCVALKQKTAL